MIKFNFFLFIALLCSLQATKKNKKHLETEIENHSFVLTGK